MSQNNLFYPFLEYVGSILASENVEKVLYWTKICRLRLGYEIVFTI